MSDVLNLTVRMAALTCCHAGCGIVFAVPQWWESERRRDHTWWYCPNGHRQYFSGQSEEEKLRADVARKTAQLDQAQARARDLLEQKAQVERRLSATRGQVTKIKNRVSKGVCPCCKRTFADLARHMEGKHPEWAGAEV